MSFPEKWIAGLDPAASVMVAVQSVLRDRLANVESAAKRVVKTKAEHDEAVHQLRVSTRRAEAALLAFRPWVRKAYRKGARQQLKSVRCAAGLVRSADVHRSIVARAHVDSSTSEQAAIEAVTMLWTAERRAALYGLLAAAKSLRRWLDRVGSRWVRKPTTRGMHGECNLTLGATGSAALSTRASEFLNAAESDLSCREALHHLRLQGKRLRYALEIFGASSINPDALATLHDQLIAFQDRLGSVNDDHEVAQRLQDDAKLLESTLVRDGMENKQGPRPLCQSMHALAERFELRCQAAIVAFLEWWQSEDATAFQNGVRSLVVDAPCPNDAQGSSMPELVVLHRDPPAGNHSADGSWAVASGVRGESNS